MIDKPNGKFEHFLERAIEWLREFAGEFREVLEAGMESINAKRKEHPCTFRSSMHMYMRNHCGGLRDTQDGYSQD